MNSELEDLELDALLEDLQKDSDELDKLCLEFDTELNRLLELDEKNLQKLESIRQIRSLERALEVLASTFDRLTIDKKEFFIVLKKLSNSFFKLKKLSTKIILINHFKHLIEIFQMIKHENHLVLLQPRLQSINSIKA